MASPTLHSSTFNEVTFIITRWGSNLNLLSVKTGTSWDRANRSCNKRACNKRTCASQYQIWEDSHCTHRTHTSWPQRMRKLVSKSSRNMRRSLEAWICWILYTRGKSYRAKSFTTFGFLRSWELNLMSRNGVTCKHWFIQVWHVRNVPIWTVYTQSPWLSTALIVIIIIMKIIIDNQIKGHVFWCTLSILFFFKRRYVLRNMRQLQQHQHKESKLNYLVDFVFVLFSMCLYFNIIYQQNCMIVCTPQGSLRSRW